MLAAVRADASNEPPGASTKRPVVARGGIGRDLLGEQRPVGVHLDQGSDRVVPVGLGGTLYG